LRELILYRFLSIYEIALAARLKKMVMGAGSKSRRRGCEKAEKAVQFFTIA
jgi:hypothetical protein